MQSVESMQSSGNIANAVLPAVQFKVKDVFSFRYNEEETKKRFEPYHCFDGQFIVKQSENG